MYYILLPAKIIMENVCIFCYCTCSWYMLLHAGKNKTYTTINERYHGINRSEVCVLIYLQCVGESYGAQICRICSQRPLSDFLIFFSSSTYWWAPFTSCSQYLGFCISGIGSGSFFIHLAYPTTSWFIPWYHRYTGGRLDWIYREKW